ncbi:hypothetical protein [Devosia riboflavina]
MPIEYFIANGGIDLWNVFALSHQFFKRPRSGRWRKDVEQMTLFGSLYCATRAPSQGE